VFVTAYNEHAVRAFEIHALDYVLKPFEYDRLRLAVQRARMEMHKPDSAAQQTRLLALLEDLQGRA
jgi:two-component system LytT family response regulator